jgi:putative phosphoesterase
VLEHFAALAPVTAVRGNNDTAPWARRLPEVDLLQVEAVRIHILHDLAHLALDPVAAGIAVVVSGHSHRPLVTQRGDVTFVNPGSAGPRRFRLPISLAELHIEGAHVTARLIELPDVRDATARGA